MTVAPVAVPARSASPELVLAAAPSSQFSPANVASAAAVLVVAYLLARTTGTVVSALADALATHRFRVTAFIPVAKLAIYGTAVYLVVAFLFDLSRTQLVAFAGLFGAALGLGLKDVLADLVGGLVVVFEQPFRVGDKVTLGDHYGEVVDIGLRSTTLVTPTDDEVTVPNFLLSDGPVVNANAGAAEMQVAVEFYVSPSSDLARAVGIVEDALVTSPYVYVDDDCPVRVVVEDDLHYRTLRGKAYVTDLRKEIPFRTDLGERVLAAFDTAGIESPRVSPGVETGIEGAE